MQLSQSFSHLVSLLSTDVTYHIPRFLNIVGGDIPRHVFLRTASWTCHFRRLLLLPRRAERALTAVIVPPARRAVRLSEDTPYAGAGI